MKETKATTADGRTVTVTLRLAGRNGRSEHPLESFWASQRKAACRGGYLCSCVGHIHAGEVARPVPVAPQFRCEIPADAVEPKACGMCDGTGQILTGGNCKHGLRKGDRTPCTEKCVKREACMNCLGTGVERS